MTLEQLTQQCINLMRQGVKPDSVVHLWDDHILKGYKAKEIVCHRDPKNGHKLTKVVLIS